MYLRFKEGDLQVICLDMSLCYDSDGMYTQIMVFDNMSLRVYDTLVVLCICCIDSIAVE